MTQSSSDPARDLYWDEDFAEALESWGVDHVWPEIRSLLADARGRVLDIACGTGAAMTRLGAADRLQVHGCDFSDVLIRRASSKGLNRLVVADASRLPYRDGIFDATYSIGSLEHFSEAGIEEFLQEARRVTRRISFHQIPVSRRGDEGWITPNQHYFNNTLDWWMPRFRAHFQAVRIEPSGWEDGRSVGKWFVCEP